MFKWLLLNWQSILVGSIMLLGIFVIVKRMIKDKKSGKSCSCGCENCALSSQCHGKDKKDSEK